MVVRAGFRSPCHTGETPSIQFTGEARELGLLEVHREDFGGELFLLVDDEGLSVGEPCDDIRVLLEVQDLHELSGEGKIVEVRKRTRRTTTTGRERDDH